MKEADDDDEAEEDDEADTGGAAAEPPPRGGPAERGTTALRAEAAALTTGGGRPVRTSFPPSTFIAQPLHVLGQAQCMKSGFASHWPWPLHSAHFGACFS